MNFKKNILIFTVILLCLGCAKVNALDENSSINYPVLDKIEKQVFKTVYTGDSVDIRLERLENNVFNQVYTNDTVDDRLERLSTVLEAQSSGELYKDISKLRQYQNVGTGLTAATILLLLIKGLLL